MFLDLPIKLKVGDKMTLRLEEEEPVDNRRRSRPSKEETI